MSRLNIREPIRCWLSSRFSIELFQQERQLKSGRTSACNAEGGRLPQPSRLWPLCLSCVLGSLDVPSAKHLLTLGDLLSLNKEEARPVRRGTSTSIHMLSDKGCAPGSSIQPWHWLVSKYVLLDGIATRPPKRCCVWQRIQFCWLLVEAMN